MKKVLLILILLGALEGVAQGGAIALDFWDTYYTGTNGTTHESASVTVANNTERILVVGLGIGDTNDDASSVKWGGSGGTALTKLGSVDSTGASNTSYWYLKNPTAQTSTVYVTTNNSDHVIMMIVSLYNVDQVTTFRGGAVTTATGSSGTTSTMGSISTVSGDWLLDFLHVRNGAADPGNLVPGAGTEPEELQAQVVYRASGRYQLQGGTSVTPAWTWTECTGGSAGWTHVAAILIPSSSGSPHYYYTRMRNQ